MANLDFYGMFDFAEGDSDIYQYSSAEFAELVKGLAGNGVSQNVGDSFAITANGLELTVGNGNCFINGRFGFNEDSSTITLDAETASLQRIDRVIIQLDTANRKMELLTVKGTAASTATAPDLTQNDLIYQLPLYRALITNGSTVTLTDERTLTYSAAEIQNQLNTIVSTLANKSDIGHTHAQYSLTTHTHVIANITDLQAALDGKASSSHTHSISDVTGLQTALDGKAAASHTHSIANVTSLQTTLDGKAATSHTHSIYAALSHTHAISEVTNLQATLDAKQKQITSGTASPSGGSSGDIYLKYS